MLQGYMLYMHALTAERDAGHESIDVTGQCERRRLAEHAESLQLHMLLAVHAVLLFMQRAHGSLGHQQGVQHARKSCMHCRCRGW